MKFTARLSTPQLDIGSLLTLVPQDHTGGLPRPVVDPGTVLMTETPTGHVVELVAIETTSTAGMTREMVVRRPDNRLFRLSPQTPSEPGGIWEPGRGMTVWVARWQVEG